MRFRHWIVVGGWLGVNGPPKGTRLEQLRYSQLEPRPAVLGQWDCVMEEEGKLVVRPVPDRNQHVREIANGDTFLFV